MLSGQLERISKDCNTFAGSVLHFFCFSATELRSKSFVSAVLCQSIFVLAIQKIY